MLQCEPSSTGLKIIRLFINAGKLSRQPRQTLRAWIQRRRFALTNGSRYDELCIKRR